MADSIDDILQRHLDGDLTESESLGLLNALQHDSELRSDLDELETIKELARDSFHAVTVPAAQTDKLYGALGYSMPSGSARVVPMWMRYGAVAAAASLITAGVMSIDTGEDTPSQPLLAGEATEEVIVQRTVESAVEQSSEARTSESLANAVDGTHSNGANATQNAQFNGSNERNNVVSEQAPRTSVGDIAQDNTSREMSASEVQATELATSSLIAEQSISLQRALNNGYVGSELGVQNERMTTIHASAPQFAPLEEASGAFSLSYRTLQSQSDISVDVPTQAISQNYAVTIGYELNENLSLVLEGGQEHFAQRFMTTTDAGRPVEIQQQPYVTWLTAGARYEMPLIKLDSDILISPFVQTSAGAAIQQGNGFMGRGVVGSVFQPVSWFKVMAGWEYSMFVYSTAAGNEQTVNTGLTIGGMIQLR